MTRAFESMRKAQILDSLSKKYSLNSVCQYLMESDKDFEQKVGKVHLLPIKGRDT